MTVKSYLLHLPCVGKNDGKCLCVVHLYQPHFSYLCSSSVTQHFCCSHKLCVSVCVNTNVCLCLCVIFSHLTPSTDLSKGLTVQLSKHRLVNWLTDPVQNVFASVVQSTVCGIFILIYLELSFMVENSLLFSVIAC